MNPTFPNITEVAVARLRAIRSRAYELGITHHTDAELLDSVITEAFRYVGRTHHAPRTAQEAVAWAIIDMRPR